MFYKAVLFAVLALCVHQGHSLKCITCDSQIEKHCSDNVNSTELLIDCTLEVVNETLTWIASLLGNVEVATHDANTPLACYKVVRQDGDKTTVLRGCNLDKTDKFDYCEEVKQEKVPGKLAFCGTCNTEGCNHASGLTSSAFTLLVLLTAARACGD